MAAANAIFLDLTGPGGPVIGSCTDAQFKGKIELKSFAFAVAPVPRKRVGAPSASGVKAMSDRDRRSRLLSRGKDDEKEDDKKPSRRKDDSITVVKVIEASTAELFMYYCKHLKPNVQGQEFPAAVVTFRLSRGESPVKLLELKFKDLYLIDYQLEPVNKDTTHPTEKLSFSYKACTIDYTAEPLSPSAPAVLRTVTWVKPARDIQ
jgi:type VI protein secretion system component Hcp